MAILINFFSIFLIYNISRSQNINLIKELSYSYKIKSFTVINNSNNSKFIILNRLDNNINCLEILDGHYNSVFKKTNLNVDLHDSNNRFVYNGNLYFFFKCLYSINLNNFKLDSFRLNLDTYYNIQLVQHNSQMKLMISNEHVLELYDFPEMHLTNKIDLNNIKYTIPQFFDKYIIFNLDKDNGIVAYDIEINKVIWTFDAGTRPISILGIKVGSMPNICRRFKIINQSSVQPYVLLATMTGDLFKLDLLNGTILNSKDRFRGDGNNQGALRHLHIYDLDNDGENEIIAPSLDNNIYCLDKNLELKWVYNTGNENQMPLSFMDINDDNIVDVLGVNDYDNKLSIINGKNGKLIKEIILDNKGEFNQTSIYLLDINNNGNLDLVCQNSRTSIQIFEVNKIKTAGNKKYFFPKE